MAILYDESAVNALQMILGDTDVNNPIYDIRLLVNALQDNRATVRYRNPYIKATGVYVNFGYPNTIRVPESETSYSLLQNEPGGYNAQAQSFVRHWDSSVAPEVYVSGILKTITTDYTVDYPKGRLTFTATIGDWQPVNASFCYYRVYHAARTVLLQQKSNARSPIEWSEAGVSEKYGYAIDAIRALDQLIASMSPQNNRIAKRIY